MSESVLSPQIPQGQSNNGDSCKLAPAAKAQTSPNGGTSQRRRTRRNPRIGRNPNMAPSLGRQSHHQTINLPSSRPATRAKHHRGKQVVSEGGGPVRLTDSRNSTGATRPCHSWQQSGTCAKGDKCRFTHDPQGSDLRPLHPTTSLTETNFQVQEALLIKARAEVEERRRVQAAQAEAELAKQQELRRARQEAQKAEYEAFIQARLAEQAARMKEEAARVVQQIVLGSIVTFGAGLDIRHTVTGFESCLIRVKNLPPDAKGDEVHALFTQQGIQPENFHVLDIRKTGGTQEARVLSDAGVGEVVSVGLDGIEFRQVKLVFEVCKHSSVGGMGAFSRGDPNALTISWWAPSVCFIAQYSDIAQAEAKVRELNGKMCGGRRVRVEMNRPPGAVLMKFKPNSVKINGLSPSVMHSEVETFSGSSLLQRLQAKEYNIDQALTLLRQHMERNADGQVNFERPPTDVVDGIIATQARFDSWDDAKRVHDSLINKRIPYIANSTFRLRLADPLRYVITISAEQYKAQSKQWGSLTDATRDSKNCHLHINHWERVSIRVVGRDKKLVGSLKVRVENLVAGEKLESWHRSLGFPFLERVFQETGAYVWCDRRLRVLKVYGDPSSVQSARTMVESEIKRLASLEQTVFLKRQSIRFFVQHGLAVLKETLGEDNVSLNLSPCTITIRGGEDARHALDKLIQESLSDMAMSRSAESGSLCPVCYSDVSSPVRLACGHCYCTACIRHFLTTACDTKIFPLSCLGDEDKCHAPIPISTIQKFLPPLQFDRLVEVAFVSFLEQHPQQFKYCTTPDCTQIYRSDGSTSVVQRCPSCFVDVCSACHGEAHEGMSCTERKLLDNPAEQKRLDEELARGGFKKCPQCKVWIQKTEGCNHMECKCGTHFCWVCMGSFDADRIYEHMATAHGGIHGEPGNNIAGEGDFYEQEQIMLHGQLLRAAQEVRRREEEERQRRVAEQRRMEEERRREVERRRVEDERRVAEQRREEEERRMRLERWWEALEEGRRRLAEQRRLDEVEQRRLDAMEQRRLDEVDQRRVAEQRRLEEQQRQRRVLEYRRTVQRETEAAEQKRRQQNKGFGCIIM